MSFLSTNKNYKRLYSAPLDVTSVFDTKSELDAYLSNPTAYVGQVISCKETDLVYLIKSDKTLLEIGKKEEPVIQNGMMIHSASDDKYYYYDNANKKFVEFEIGIDKTVIDGMITYNPATKTYKRYDLDSDSFVNFEIPKETGNMIYDVDTGKYKFFNGTEYENLSLDADQTDTVKFDASTGGYYYINADGERVELEIGNQTQVATLKSDYEGSTQTVSSEEEFSFPIFFTTPNVGTAYVHVLVNNVEVKNEMVTQGNSKINIGRLEKGNNSIKVYVVDRAGVYSNEVKFNVLCGALEIKSTFDPEVDFNLGNPVRIDFTASQLNSNPLTLNVLIDERITTKPISAGFNTYNIENLTIGVHKVTLYLTDTEIESNRLNYQIVVIDSQNLYISSQFDATVEYKESDKVSIDYRISYAASNEFNVKYYIDGTLFRTLNGVLGINYWNISTLAEGDRTLKIEVSTKDGSQTKELEFTIKILPSDFTRLEVPKVGMLFDFSAQDLSNSDIGKENWTDKSGNNVVAELVGFNFSSNGWMNDALVCDGETYVKINTTPLEDNIKYGFTLDCQFEVSDTGKEARVLDLTSPAASAQGFYIGVNTATLKSKSNVLSTGFNEDTKTRITFAIDRDNKFAKIYVNAVLCECYKLTDDGVGVSKVFEDFSNSSYIYLNSRKGTSEFGNCKIYGLRGYDRCLTDDEIIQLHLADIKDTKEQEAKYNFNFNNELPTIYVYGDTTGISKDDRVKVRINYMSTDETKYGSSFDLNNCELHWQGTSSLQYPVKNYRIRLYDEFGEKYMYSPFPNGIKENLFCLKADMMDSAHYRNTGNATYINDNLYSGTLNPAQQIDANVRNTIDGFPINLYINGEYIGVFNFNNDKSDKKVFGLTKSFPQCISYEVSANSNTTAGAFNKWTSATGLTEKQYYYNDFELRYSSRSQDADEDNWDITPLKTLVDWVSDADETEFKTNLDQHFNRRYLIDYYIFTMTAGLIDNFGKNMMLTTWDSQIFYPQFYDCDSCLSLNNSGYRRYDPYIEVTPDVFNTSDSKLWTKLTQYLWDEIVVRYRELRNSVLTYDRLMEYYYGHQISKIPERLYNTDMNTKYLNHTEYLFMLHGNDLEHLKSWLSKRISFLDNFFDYAFDENNTITIRANKHGNVYLDIETYGEQYVKVKWKNGVEQKLRVESGKPTRFTGSLATNQDQEIIIYNVNNLKSIGDISNLNPSQLFLGNATRLTELICHSDKLLNVDVSNNTYLQKIDLKGCSLLGKETGAVMDVSGLNNLKYLNIYGTNITSVKTNTAGGNLVEIYYPKTIKSIDVRNQSNLTTLAIPNGNALDDLTLVNLDNLVNINATYDENGNLTGITSDIESIFNNLQTINIQNCLDVTTTLSIQDTRKLVSLVLVGMDNLQSIVLGGNSTTSEGFGLLSNISISECNKFNTIRIRSSNELTHFIGNTTIDLGNCYGLANFFDEIGIEGTEKILLPNSIKVIQSHGPNKSSITKMWLKDNTTATEGFDQQGMTLTNNTLDFYSLTNLPSWNNMNYITTSLDPNINTQRTSNGYMRLYGTINFSRWDVSSEEKTALLVRAIKGLTVDSPDYTLILPEGLDLDSLAKLEFKALPDTTPWSEVFTKINDSALTDAAELFMNRNFVDDNVDLVLNAPSLVNCTSMFKGSNIPRITSIDLTTNCILDSMFEECRGLQADCLIPMTTASCKRMFYNCSNIVTTSNNYERYYGHYFETLGMYYGVGATSYTYPKEMTVNKLPTNNLTSSEVNEYISCWGTYYYVGDHNETNSGSSGIEPPVGLLDLMTYYYEIKIGKPGLYFPISTSYIAKNHLGITVDPTKLYIPYIVNCEYDDEMYKLIWFNNSYFQDSINKLCGVKKINNLLCFDEYEKALGIKTVNFNNYKNLTSALKAFYKNTKITTVNMPDTYNLENGNNMFYQCTNLTTFTIPSLQKLKNGSNMFFKCNNLSFDNIPVTEGFPELINGDNMFTMCKKLTTVDLKNTNKLVNADYMFLGCIALTEVKNLNHCTALKSMYFMFQNTHITSIDLSGLSKLENIGAAFWECTNLTTVTGLNDLVNCTNISSTFIQCTALTNLNNGQEVLLPKVTNAKNAFEGCTALKQVNLNLPSVTNLSSNANGIFTGCALTKATLKATSCANASDIFSGMSSLQELDFNPGNNCTTYNNTLKGCTGLTKLKINVTNYDSEGQTKEVSTATSSEKCLLYDCTELTDLYLYGEIKHRMNFSKNEKLSAASWTRIIDALHDYSGESGGTTHVIIMSEEKYRSLTPEGFKQFGDKGWTVARP